MPPKNFDLDLIIAGLNDRQKEAVKATKGPVLVVAGPGSGKTRVLTCRIAWLLATQEARPDQVLALTFTNKAAREMRERVQKLLPRGMAKGMWIGTFHSQMVRLLRVEAKHLGYTSDFTIYDPNDSDRLLKQLIDESDFDPKVIKPRTIRSYISSAKNAQQSAGEMEMAAKSKQAKAAAKLFDPFNDALKGANAFDFDDLLLKPLEIFEQYPDILQKYQHKWSHVLIDEYQDTNRVQYSLAYALSGGHRNLCVVGDDAQSIYSFRGADIQNILSFERDFDEAKVVRLEQNYRSTENILNAADSVIANNTNQIRKTLWTTNQTGEQITLIEALNGRDEAYQAVKTIRGHRAKSNLKFQDFAILYRTNVQSRAFEDALRSNDIPYRVIGGTSFYERKEIKDAIAYLRLLVNPNDVSSFQRIVNYPARGIGLKSQQKILEFARQPEYDLKYTLSEVQNLSIPQRSKHALNGFVELIRSHTEDVHSGMKPNKVAESLLKKSGLIGELNLDETPSGQDRIKNVEGFLQGLEEYAEIDPSHTLSSYLQMISLMTDADTDKSSDDRVILMTLHASKGLEFQVVFIGGLEERLLPLIRGEEISEAALEEERRLFYVGVTRAKSRLYLGRAQYRSRYGGADESYDPSRFIFEIDPRVLKNRVAKSPRTTQSNRSKFKRNSLGQSQRSGRPNRAGNRHRVLSSKPTGSRTIRPRNLENFTRGAHVKHERYGLGRILLVEGRGENIIVTVSFDKFDQKRLRVKFAPMDVIQDTG